MRFQATPGNGRERTVPLDAAFWGVLPAYTAHIYFWGATAYKKKL